MAIPHRSLRSAMTAAGWVMGTEPAGQFAMMKMSRTAWACLALAAGAGLAAMWLPQGRLLRSRRSEELDSRVDDALDDSFPASDPPSFSAPASTQAGPSPLR